jgi:hypothetical protein
MSEARSDILVTGAGALATAILHSLVRAGGGLRISLMSRESQRLRWLVRSAAASAACLGFSVHIEPAPVDWADRDALHRVLERTKPRMILHTASLQSPWALCGADAWARLVRVAGYGLTLPLHLVLARRLGHAIAGAVPDALFINACYPDAVNPMLVSEGIPVLCGVGNVAILISMMAADVNTPGHLRMIAHHSHVSAAITGNGRLMDGFRAWRDGAPIDDEAREWLRQASLPGDERLNLVTGAGAAAVALSLLGIRGPLRTSLPGPFGWAGGYPVCVERARLAIDLPAGLTEDMAKELNDSAAALDGVQVDSHGIASFAERVSAATGEIPSQYRCITDPLPVQAAEARAHLLIQLRSLLSESH